MGRKSHPVERVDQVIWLVMWVQTTEMQANLEGVNYQLLGQKKIVLDYWRFLPKDIRITPKI